MANPSKAKGTSAESAIVAYLRGHGFSGAMRPALSGSKDVGDVWLEPGPTVVIESKSVAGPAALGAPPAKMLALWWAQTVAEAEHAGADVGVLVVKRKGTADPGRWFAWLPGWIVHEACVGSPVSSLDDLPAVAHLPVCVDLAHAVVLLRRTGYGDVLDRDALVPDEGDILGGH